MIKKNKFSIIMPFFNSEQYIERAILSVINQSYKNWELIAVNDGSKDSSSLIIDKYAKNDNRIRIIIKDNGGYATAINFGLEHLSTDSNYFLMMGSDDELYFDLLERINNKLHDTQYDLIGFRTKIIYESGKEEYDEYSYINLDITETDTDIISFYSKYTDIFKNKELFSTRDTSRCFKKEILKGLRYFGKYGVSSDGIFSMLFSYRCHSFAHFAIDGYKWHLRNDSVSQSNPSDQRLTDRFQNWTMFFSIVIDNNYELTPFSQQYISFYRRQFVNIICGTTLLYNMNKSLIFKSRKLLFFLSKKYNIFHSKKDKIIIMFPHLYRCFFRIRHKHSYEYFMYKQ